MSQPLWHSIPFLLILLPLFGAALTSVLKKNAARNFVLSILGFSAVLSCVFIFLVQGEGASYTYTMGHWTAPWGNEIRAGLLEAVTGAVFTLVMFLAALGGSKKAEEHILLDKQPLFYVMVLLLQAALTAQVYTNDIFTAYVFVEIMTLTACALIAARKRGRTLVAAARYMIMNLVGSGLFLLGIILLYSLTGHLLMSNIHESVAALHASGEYRMPLIVSIALMTIGLCIKSALFPFHTWVPDAYSHSTPTAAAILSSLVSKGYIFLLIKIIYRVIGLDIFAETGILNVLFIYALLGMIIGSLLALQQNDIRAMIALSSVAQIGYIYVGIGMGTESGMLAAMFHVYAHSVCKSMLFLSSGGLADASGNSKLFHDLKGSGVRSPVAGIAFVIGALGMVGFPFLGGFVSKINFALGALEMGGLHMLLVLLCLIASTWLNTLYFLRTVVTLYSKPDPRVIYPKERGKRGKRYLAALILLCIFNVALGLFSQPVLEWIRSGLEMFS